MNNTTTWRTWVIGIVGAAIVAIGSSYLSTQVATAENSRRYEVDLLQRLTRLETQRESDRLALARIETELNRLTIRLELRPGL